jgi:hypothetical protein
MGFTYTMFGLCCDFCGVSRTTDQVRKINCPYAYCQAWACCENCKQKKLHLRSSCEPEKLHKDYCKLEAEKVRQRENERQKLLHDGHFLRVAAQSQGDKVKVLFRNLQKEEIAVYMTHAEYDRVPILANAKLEDYEILYRAKSTNLMECEA